ncbi:flavodoxin family protein [Succinivibrio dextrinosolvens]|uniref:flavodoxin family protein n=1 Tax=Succinivibrio dextrinosolvens TaxID=83771 RepID=UPI0004E1FE0F|nr:flavodoxin family protein [Succinivibrio dextrinosolvens]
MARNILIVSSSLRAGSNSELISKEVERGALSAGNNVEFLSLKDRKIEFCIGCLKCQKQGKCILKDDMSELIEKVNNADTLVFSTPIYYYEMSGLLKTFLDRCNPLYIRDYHFREVYLITASAENSQTVYQRAKSGIEGFVECFPNAEFKCVFSGGGLTNPQEIKTHDEILERAFAFGTKI